MPDISTISVVIANYNYGLYLPRLFAAISEQSYPLEKVEVIFVDDASSDDSVQIARELGEKLPCANFLQLQAGGKRAPGPVRNKGFGKATGKYLLYIDADDLIAPDYLQCCAEVLDARAEVDLVYTSQCYLQDEELAKQNRQCTAPSSSVMLPVANRIFLAWQNVVTSPAMFRRKVWETSQGFRHNTKYEDWDFWVQASANGFIFERIEDALFIYARHNGSFSELAEREDGIAKAHIVENNAEFFPPMVRKWARRVLSGDLDIYLFPKGVIPLADDALESLR